VVAIAGNTEPKKIDGNLAGWNKFVREFDQVVRCSLVGDSEAAEGDERAGRLGFVETSFHKDYT